MRFPADRIKDAILHPDPAIRARATAYFAHSFSQDTSLMAQVIKAVETYGREDASPLFSLARDLPQTEQSVDWVIDELNATQSDQYEDYTGHLSMVLVQADPHLLLPRKDAVLEARHFRPSGRPALTERLEMLSWDAATCWRALEEFCEREKGNETAGGVDLEHAHRIVEALARRVEGSEAKVQALLRLKVVDFHDNPMTWMEPLVVRLAGETRMESAIPSIIGKLLEDGSDILNEECSRALTRIGTPAVIRALAEAFPGSEDHFRIYAASALENIHLDLAVEECLRLLEQEQGEMTQGLLAHALLTQFAEEGIEAARKQLLGRALDFEGRGLRNHLLETCTLTGARFPEYDEWLARSRVEKEEHQKRVKELEGDPSGMLLFALENLAGKKAVEVPRSRPPLPPGPRLTLPSAPAKPRKVGRNEPCPCGSGKKFKMCCGRR